MNNKSLFRTDTKALVGSVIIGIVFLIYGAGNRTYRRCIGPDFVTS